MAGLEKIPIAYRLFSTCSDSRTASTSHFKLCRMGLDEIDGGPFKKCLLLIVYFRPVPILARHPFPISNSSLYVRPVPNSTTFTSHFNISTSNCLAAIKISSHLLDLRGTKSILHIFFLWPVRKAHILSLRHLNLLIISTPRATARDSTTLAEGNSFLGPVGYSPPAGELLGRLDRHDKKTSVIVESRHEELP